MKDLRLVSDTEDGLSITLLASETVILLSGPNRANILLQLTEDWEELALSLAQWIVLRKAFWEKQEDTRI